MTQRPTFDERTCPEPNTGCVLWTRNLNSYGYGRLIVKGHEIGAHRFAYQRAFGPIPEGLVVMHKCDTPACVNPAHLSLGTHYDNARDCTLKRRRARGIKNGRAKVTPDQVKEIRRLHAEGMTHKELAVRFGISNQMSSYICIRRFWKEVL